MVGISLNNNVIAMRDRYDAHLERGNHVLRPGSQQEAAHATVAYFHETEEGSSNLVSEGAGVAPGGSGKTVMALDLVVGINTMLDGRYVLGDPVLGKRVIISVPTNQLVDQWADTALGEDRQGGIFGDKITQKHVGIYHADMLPEEKQAALEKPILIIVHDSLQVLVAHQGNGVSAPLIRAEDYDLLEIDEVDAKPRGAVTREFFQKTFFGKCMVIGYTATPNYRNGKSIGDYLFGSKKPMFEIPHEQAVDRLEIAQHINIIFQPEILPESKVKVKDKQRWEDYTDAEQLQFIRQTGSDESIVEMIRKGKHPITKKPLQDMLQLHKGVTVEHGRYIADMLNDEFGNGYARVVWGDMDPYEHEDTLQLVKTGKLPAVVQCKYWGRGTNIVGLEMTVQHAISCALNDIIQFHTRASRKYGDKISLYLCPYLPGFDQLVIGELLGGMYMIPDHLRKWDFPQPNWVYGPATEIEPWPDIRGVKVYYTLQHMEMFAALRQQDLYEQGLPVKPKNMLSLEEMAAELNIAPDILDQRVYKPLAAAYEKRKARDKYVETQDGIQDETIFVRKQKFAVRRIGDYKHGDGIVFCIDTSHKTVCEYALYGRLDPIAARPELLTKQSLQARLAMQTDEQQTQFETLWTELQQAFFERPAYARSIELEGMKFGYEDFGFFKNAEGKPEFHVAPDVLEPAYRYCHACEPIDIETWVQSRSIRMLKTSEWLTEGDVIKALELNPFGDEAKIVKKRFQNIQASVGRSLKREGDEAAGSLGKVRSEHSVQVALKWLPLATQEQARQLCVHRLYLERLKKDLGRENNWKQTVFSSPGRVPG